MEMIRQNQASRLGSWKRFLHGSLRIWEAHRPGPSSAETTAGCMRRHTRRRTGLVAASRRVAKVTGAMRMKTRVAAAPRLRMRHRVFAPVEAVQLEGRARWTTLRV